jgi:DNA repair photolyase
LFKEWLMAHYPDRFRHVMKLVRETRGGKDYDSTWGKRMTGDGPYAWMIGRRFEAHCGKLGLNAPRPRLSTEQFQKPKKSTAQLSLF